MTFYHSRRDHKTRTKHEYLQFNVPAGYSHCLEQQSIGRRYTQLSTCDTECHRELSFHQNVMGVGGSLTFGGLKG